MMFKIYRALLHPILTIEKIICLVRSFIISLKIDKGKGRILVQSPFLNISIKKGKNAKLVVNGDLRFCSHVGGITPIKIFIEENATLTIDGDFIIGHGVRILLLRNSILYFGGKNQESDSGITSDVLVMVYKSITIGKDFICAWNCFISDSDWHCIEGQNHHSDIIIGDHVWIANNNNILKGSNIGNNCIIASSSKVINCNYPDNVLIGGIPSKIIKTGVNWKRDIK